MNTNCPNCDKPDCDLVAAREASDAYPWNRKDATTNSEWKAIRDRLYFAETVCEINTVNWRARALTEAARADAAEAELRVLREALPKWRDNVLTTPVGAKIGFIESYSTYWLAMLDGEISVGRAGEIGKARRLVEQHHGLPPCEVLP